MKYTRIFFFISIVLLFASCEILFDVPLSWNKIVKDKFTGMWITNGANDGLDTLIIRKNGREYEMTEYYGSYDGTRKNRHCGGYLTILNNTWFLNSYHHQIGPYNVSKIEIKDDSLFISDIEAYDFFSDYWDKEDNIYRVEDPVTFRQVVKQNMLKDDFFKSPKKYR